MKYTKFLTLLIVIAAPLFTCQLFAQSTPMTKAEYNSMDSSQAVYERDQVQAQKTKDAELLQDAKTEQSDTKAKAKEAERIDDEAQDAAKQSKNALKSEKKAQKSRKQADKQAKKAEAARDKSDLN